jgi:hypothetical protein
MLHRTRHLFIRPAKLAVYVRSIRQEAACLDVLAALKSGRQPGRLRKLRDPPSTFDDSWVREQHDAIHVPTIRK